MIMRLAQNLPSKKTSKNRQKKGPGRIKNALPPNRYIKGGAQTHFLSPPKLKTGCVTSYFVLKSCFWRLRHLCTGRVSRRLFLSPTTNQRRQLHWKHMSGDRYMPLGMWTRRKLAGQNKYRVEFAIACKVTFWGLTVACRHAARTSDYVNALGRNRGQVRGMLGDPS